MDVLILLWLPSYYRVEWRGGIMLTSLDAERMKKDQLHVENMDSVSPYFNRNDVMRPPKRKEFPVHLET